MHDTTTDGWSQTLGTTRDTPSTPTRSLCRNHRSLEGPAVGLLWPTHHTHHKHVHVHNLGTTCRGHPKKKDRCTYVGRVIVPYFQHPAGPVLGKMGEIASREVELPRGKNVRFVACGATAEEQTKVVMLSRATCQGTQTKRKKHNEDKRK